MNGIIIGEDRTVRRFLGLLIALGVWIAAWAGVGLYLSAQPEMGQTQLIVSGVYAVVLLALILVGIAIHSRLLHILLVLYGLALGVLDVATFIGVSQPVMNALSPAFLAPYRGVFYIETLETFSMGSFAAYALIGIFAAVLCFAAAAGCCFVETPD